MRDQAVSCFNWIPHNNSVWRGLPRLITENETNGVLMFFYSLRQKATITARRGFCSGDVLLDVCRRKEAANWAFLQLASSCPNFLAASETCRRKHKQPLMTNHSSFGLHVASLQLPQPQLVVAVLRRLHASAPYCSHSVTPSHTTTNSALRM